MNERGLFEPDVVLPSQLDRRVPLEPERKLLLALLWGAWEDLVKYPRRSPFHRFAREWIEAADHDLCSFNTVCELIGFDAGFWRSGLLGISNAAPIGRVREDLRGRSAYEQLTTERGTDPREWED